MKLESLRVLHISKVNHGNQNCIENVLQMMANLPHTYPFETCQRWVWVWDHRVLPAGLSDPVGQTAQLLSGSKAYRFLLRWATGLESEVVGETDIFGQIKEIWQKLTQSMIPSTPSSRPDSGLSFWMQKVFEDTKDIRTLYLQHLGGSSYGTLVRKWMKTSAARDSLQSQQRSVLLIGAGQIAQSIAPALLDAPLLLWNRDRSHLNTFYDSLMGRYPLSDLVKIEDTPQEERAWKEATHIVVCIPQDQSRDMERVHWVLQGGARGRSVIHLGVRQYDRGIWSLVENFACLDDLFVLQKSLFHLRSMQVAKAEKACDERTQLRVLGGSLSVPHGWEDLACFA